ncbi:conjugal transfer protein TraF [Methylophaga frappieri]|nr:conjugal transfer protein TraF [Methylophaga frappieri]
MHSKRFLLIYLGLVAVLLLIFFDGQQRQQPTRLAESTDRSMKSFRLTPPLPLPQVLLRDQHQALFTNTRFLTRWTFIYLYDGSCQPNCQAIWQVLQNLADRHHGTQLQFAVIDRTTTQKPALPLPIGAGSNRYWLFDTTGESPLTSFFVERHQYLGTTSFFLIGPDGLWHAGFQAPFTSAALQQAYIALRDEFARHNSLD